MAEPNIQVSTPAMQRAMQHFEGAVESSTKMMQQVNNNQAQLQSAWQGRSSTTFAQAMNTWEGQFHTIIKELIGVIEAMGGNAKAYVENEESAAQTAGAWASGLPAIDL